MSELLEGVVLDDFLKNDGDPYLRSREKETLLSGQNLTIAQVVGKVLFTIPTSGTLTSGTNGSLLVVTGGTKTQKGDYKVTCTQANAGGAAGIYRVESPTGEVLGDVTLALGTSPAAAAFTDPQINFEVDYLTGYNTVGDYWTISVTDGSLGVTVISWTAVDGSQKAYGIMAGAIDASSADTYCAVIKRSPAVITKSFLRYPLTFTSGGTADAPVAGDTLTGLTTTTTVCRVVSVTIDSGTFSGGTAAGTIIVDQLTADFTAENVEINDSTTNDMTVALTNVTQVFLDLADAGIIFREEA